MFLWPFLQMRRWKHQALFPWGLPPDWYFVGCVLGTVNWWDKVHRDIQGSSWTGLICLSSLTLHHTSLHPLLSPLGFCLIIFFLLPVLWPQLHSGPWYFHLEPLYLTVSLVCGSLFKCHLLGKILLFLFVGLISCSSSNEGKPHEGLWLSCLPLYSLYLQHLLTHKSCSEHVH